MNLAWFYLYNLIPAIQMCSVLLILLGPIVLLFTLNYFNVPKKIVIFGIILILVAAFILVFLPSQNTMIEMLAASQSDSLDDVADSIERITAILDGMGK